MSRVVRVALGVAATGVGAYLYGTYYEARAYTLRRVEVRVLAPGSAPLRVLHVSDLHITPSQHGKIEWVRGLAALEPDLVVNTGDNLAAADAGPAVVRALTPLFAFPGCFVPGNNDYFGPRRKNPARYFFPQQRRVYGTALPWPELAERFVDAGWTDLTHVRTVLPVRGSAVALAGTDDPHLFRARYRSIGGPADDSAAVRIGVIHSPEPYLLDAFARDGYDMVLAGHTHGGQVRVPFGPAIVTNCGIDGRRARGAFGWGERMFVHVSAGLGGNPHLPIRIACRPEATLLTLVARDG